MSLWLVCYTQWFSCIARVTVLGLCVCLSVCLSRTTDNDAAYERYQQLQCNKHLKNRMVILLKRRCSRARNWQPRTMLRVAAHQLALCMRDTQSCMCTSPARTICDLSISSSHRGGTDYSVSQKKVNRT